MHKIINKKETNILTGGYKLKNSKFPTLIMIHGAGMNGTVWQMQTRYLANKGLNVLSVDLPGHGYSQGKALDSIEKMSLWLIQFMDQLNIKSAIIAGHSMGSLIALESANNDKKRVKGIILLGSSSSMPVHPDLIEAARNNLPLAAEMITDWSYGKTQHIGGHPLPGYWMIDSSIQLITESLPGVLLKDLIACNEYKNTLITIENIEQQILLISGIEDKMTPIKKAKELTISNKKAKISILDKCGHMMMIEKPREVTKLIYNFNKKFIKE